MIEPDAVRSRWGCLGRSASTFLARSAEVRTDSEALSFDAAEFGGKRYLLCDPELSQLVALGARTVLATTLADRRLIP